MGRKRGLLARLTSALFGAPKPLPKKRSPRRRDEREYIVNRAKADEELIRLRKMRLDRGEAPRRRRRNPSLDAKARAQSQEFHCEPDEVLKLSAKERQPLPAEVVDLGEIHSITYGPSKRSCRGKDLWKHAMGDRGDFVPPAKGRPHLVADPNTGRPAIAAENSPATFDPKRGLVG